MLGAIAQTLATEPINISRTNPWESIRTLGGAPESVRKVTHQGTTFYLAPGVTDSDFRAVLNASPQSLRLIADTNGNHFLHPTYILWNADRTILLVYVIFGGLDDSLELLEEVAVTATLSSTQANSHDLVEPSDPELKLVRLINAERARHNLRQLEIVPHYMKAARFRSQEMVDLRYLSHQSPIHGGRGAIINRTSSQVSLGCFFMRKLK